MDNNIWHRLVGGLRSWKLPCEQFETVATIILRIPGYFVLNCWWEFDILNSVPRSMAWADVVSSGFAVFVMVQGILLLLLPLRQLVMLYMHYLTVAVLAAADQFSRYYVSSESTRVEEWPRYEAVAFQGYANLIFPHKPLFEGDPAESSYLRQQISAIVFHTLAALAVTFFLDLKNNKEKILLLVYYVPVFARLAGLPIHYLPAVHNFASCFVLLLTVMYIFLCLPHVFKFVRDTYNSLMLKLELYGAYGLLFHITNRMFVPIQLLIFWLFQYSSSLYLHILHNKYLMKPVEYSNGWDFTQSSNAPSAMQYSALYAAAETCENPLLLVATCTAVAYLSRAVFTVAQWFTVGRRGFPRPQDLTQNGVTEGATMFLLSIQTSLYSIDMPDRFSLFSVILLIVLSSLIQSTYELIEPHVMALSAQGLAPLSRHLRVVTMCLFLFCLPIYMVYMFTLIFEQDFWLLLVVCTSIMTAVQVFGLFMTYCLLTYDALCAENWPGLDDVLYYSRATTRVFEFLVAVFVVGAGIKETLAGQWTLMNIVVLIIHCYFNVFQRLQQGWKSFLLRLEAAKKISGLPQATVKQLEEYNDLCSICFAEMESACITTCSHLFHPPCLRKWLYVQDKCPLCQTSITVPMEDTVTLDTATTTSTTPDSREGDNSTSVSDTDTTTIETCSIGSDESSSNKSSNGGGNDDTTTTSVVDSCTMGITGKVQEPSLPLLPDAIEHEVGYNIPLIEDSEEEEEQGDVLST